MKAQYLLLALPYLLLLFALSSRNAPVEGSAAPEPLKYEYRAISIHTGQILYVTSVPKDTIVHSIEINGVPESSYRLERHLIRDAIKGEK